ncbi:MAG: hypothetical protein FJW34_04190 [Acidobacteria bacterium]|nr:hypothetical protein [Acidobacteriota bacterium]
MIHRRALLLTPLAVAACRRRKSSGFAGYAFVANQEGQALAAVDLTTFTLARHIRLEGRPAQVLALGSSVYALTPDSGTVHQISAPDLAFRRRMRVAREAVWMRLAADGMLWVLCREPRQLVGLPLNGPRGEIRIELPLEPLDFDLSADGRWAAISFGAAGAVAFVGLEQRSCLPPVRLGREAATLRFRFDGRLALVGSPEERTLSVLEAPTARLLVRLPLAVRPEHFCFKSDGGQLFITGAGMDAVAIVYPYSTEIAETVLAGKAPGAMAASSQYLFVANPPTRDVTILDIETRKAIAVAAVGDDPGFVTLTPDEQFALVLNRRSGDMAVIRLATITAKRARSAPLFTLVPVGSRPVSAAVCTS